MGRFLRLARGLSIACLVAAVPRAVLAAPANGTCATAAPLAFPSVTEASTAEQDELAVASACGREDRYALWYSFTAPEAGRYTVTTAGSTGLTDTTIDVYPSCDAASMACNDDTLDSVLAAIDLDLESGQNVLLRVAGWGKTRGDFKLTVNHPDALARPPNDACSDAPALAFPSVTPATTLHATGTDVTSCGGEDASDIWYTFTAPETRDYDFFLTQNSTSANLVALFTGCGTGEIACGLNAASAHLDAGQMVFLRVGTNPDVADEFNVNVGPFPPTVAPPNDTFANATPITSVPQTIAGTTVGATEDALNWGPICGPFVNDAVWYSFTAPEDGAYVFDTNGSAMEDTVIAVFDECQSGNGLPPALLGCDDESGVGHQARIEGSLSAGQSVCIAVAGHYLSERGAFTLNVAHPPKHPVNDECAGALPLPFPGKVAGDNYTSRSEQPSTACPPGDRALWYAFTAPADGVYKFDVKESVETSPDIAIYPSCGGDALACSADPKPAVSLEMKADQKVFVRISTDVYVRAPMVLRVGPAGMPTSSGTGGAGGGSSSSTSSGSTSSSGGGSGGGSPEEPTDGCGCRAAGSRNAEAPIAALVLALACFARARRRAR